MSFSTQRIHEILTQMGQEDLDSVDKSMVSEVARKAGAGAVVLGSIFKSGDEIRIDVQVEDVSSGRVLSAESVRGDDVFPLVDELTGRIQAGLEVNAPTEARTLAEVTTSSLEAYQLYSDGTEAFNNARFSEARRLFEQSRGNRSFLCFGPSGSFQGLLRTAARPAWPGTTSSRPTRICTGCPKRQKLFVQARYAQLEKDDSGEAAALLESLLTRHPNEERAYMALSNVYLRLSETQKRLETLERGVAALPRPGAIYNLYGYALLDAGRYPEGIRAFEAYARLLPGEPNPHDSLAEAYLITGQPDRAVAQYTRALEVAPSFVTSHLGRAFAHAVLGRYDEFFQDIQTLKENPDASGVSPASLHFARSLGLSRVGRYREAETERRAGTQIARRLDAPDRHAALELLGSLHALEQGHTSDASDARSRIEALAAGMDSLPHRYLTVAALLVAGTAEARSGDLDAARRHLEIQRELLDERDEAEVWWHHSLEGEVALAAGDLHAAETAFAAGEPESKMKFYLGPPRGVPWSALSNSLPFHDGRARARKAQGDLPGAIRIYRDLLTPDMSSKWTAWLEPRYVLRLARLLHESGDREGARAEYERFLNLWKDADAGLPEVAEARAYLAN